MGTVAFLLGDGRYGVFEIAKHVAPGILVRPVRAADASARGAAGPARRLVGRSAGSSRLGRFATIFAVTLAVQAPAVAWAFLVPGLTIHTTFGVLSG